MPIEKALLLTLWTLASKDSFRAISDRFNVSRGCAHYTFMYTCKLISKLAPEYIKWPKNEAELKEISSKFNNLRGSESLPNVVGCVDGTHIEITAPNNDKISYYNRKGYYSLILQVCTKTINFKSSNYFYILGCV